MCVCMEIHLFIQRYTYLCVHISEDMKKVITMVLDENDSYQIGGMYT
jgi:hypothetical protein